MIAGALAQPKRLPEISAFLLFVCRFLCVTKERTCLKEEVMSLPVQLLLTTNGQ